MDLSQRTWRPKLLVAARPHSMAGKDDGTKCCQLSAHLWRASSWILGKSPKFFWIARSRAKCQVLAQNPSKNAPCQIHMHIASPFTCPLATGRKPSFSSSLQLQLWPTAQSSLSRHSTVLLLSAAKMSISSSSTRLRARRSRVDVYSNWFKPSGQAVVQTSTAAGSNGGLSIP